MNHAALVKAANTFEASLMQELLKPLSAKDPLFSESGGGAQDDDTESGGVLASFGSESLAQAMAAHGGLGIGKQVVGQLEQQAARGAANATKVSKKNSSYD